MGRLVNARLDQQAFGLGQTQPLLDLSYGGQGGWSPMLSEWISNQAYVRRQMVCILLEAPAFFQLMPDPGKWVQALKSLVELHPKSIEGMNAGLEVSVEEHAVGGAGEMQQEYVDVKRTRSEPVFTFTEKYGMPIQTLLYNWITFSLMDPDTKFAMTATLNGAKPADLLADWYSMSCLFFEPDPTHKFIQNSWVTTNMWPKNNGEIIGKRDLTTGSELRELTIPFTGISQSGIGCNLFAQAVLDAINTNNANPNLRPSFLQNLSADVQAAAEEGYAINIADMGRQAVPGIR